MRLVIKLGSSTVTCGGVIDAPQLIEYARLCRQLIDAGVHPVLVSSGAVAAGRAALVAQPGMELVATKQMLAAIGQPRLMALYGDIFAHYGLKVAQVLLTRADLERRRSYLNARQTFHALLAAPSLVPIVNENDTVATEEIRVGDNDQLSALVAGLIDADKLVLMTDQHGLYDADPRAHPEARLIERIDSAEIPEAVWLAAGGSAGQLGTGGMATKLKAADIARRNGIEVLIAHGREPGEIHRLLAGTGRCTRFAALTPPREARKRYILSGLRTGVGVRVDGGAVEALKQGRSLLAVGVREVEGDFDRGDTVNVLAPDGDAQSPLARGVANYSAQEVRRIAGKRSTEIAAVLGYDFGAEFIHRDHLVLL